MIPEAGFMDIFGITERIRYELNTNEENISDAEVRDFIERKIFADENMQLRSLEDLSLLIDNIFYSLRCDLGILQPYIEDRDVNEIMVNGKDDIFIEKGGRLVKADRNFATTEELEEVIRRVAANVHREINELSPIVDARLKDGSRVNAVYKNIALNGPIFTIRKFPEKGYTMNDLIAMGTLTEECADFLKVMVRDGYNCFISGGTSSGKTTFLNVLADYIPGDERLIVIEDSAELQISSCENIVRLECRNANVTGKGAIGMDSLIKTSLRMRPDRIIVGEVRGKEVMDMINAMNTGHQGSLSTGHGNSIEGMLRRLESMVLQAAEFPVEAIRSQIAEAIDIIIHLGRMENGERKVLEVAEIYSEKVGEIKTSRLFSYSKKEGLVRTGKRIKSREKLELKGDENLDI